MSEQKLSVEDQVDIIAESLGHIEAASLTTNEVLLSVVEKLVQSNQVFTRAEAESIVALCQEANSSHREVKHLLAQLAQR